MLDKAQDAITAKKFDEARTLLDDASTKYADFEAKIEEIVREADLQGIFEDLDAWFAEVDAWIDELEDTGYDVTKVKEEWEAIKAQYESAKADFAAGDDKKAWQTWEKADKEYAKWESKLEKELNAQDKEWQEWCDALGGWHEDLKEFVEGEREPASKAKEAGYAGADVHLRYIEVEVDTLLETAGKALEEGDCGWAAENLEGLEALREFWEEAGNEWYNNLLEQLADWEEWLSEKAKEIEELKAKAEEKGVEVDFSEIDAFYDELRADLDQVYTQLDDEEFVGWGADDWLAEADARWEELDPMLEAKAEEIEAAEEVECETDEECEEGFICEEGECVEAEEEAEEAAEKNGEMKKEKETPVPEAAGGAQ